MRSKYIVIDNIFAIIFPDLMNHDEVANALLYAGQEVTGAGFIDVEPGSIVAFGESKSLDIKSNGTADVPALERALGWRK